MPFLVTVATPLLLVFIYILYESNYYLMTIKTYSLKINTNKNFEIIDITSQINDLINIENGMVSIFSKHSTSAIVVNENESGLLNDLEFTLNSIISDKFNYKHDKLIIMLVHI